MTRALDQAQMTFVTSEAAEMEREVMKTVVAERMYPDLVPIERGLNPAADSITQKVRLSPKGKIQPLANMANDSPNVSVDYKLITSTYVEFGVQYGWTVSDVETAQLTNTPLQSDTIESAVEIVEDAKEDIVMNGRSEYGWTGLLPASGGAHQPGTLSHTVSGGTWDSKTTEEILNDIQDAFVRVASNSKQTILPDTLLIPENLQAIFSRPLANANGITSISLMQFMRENNPYTAQRPGHNMMIKVVPRLAANTAIMYKFDPKVLRFLMPRELEFTGPDVEGWNMKWTGRVKMGGLQWRLPHGVCYITGVGA